MKPVHRSMLLLGLGVALLGLSLVPAWIFHDRHLGGHGLAHLETSLNAWELRSWPVLSAGVLAALAVAAASLVRILRPRLVPGWLPLAGMLLSLALLVASAIPLQHESHASGVDLQPGWALAVGIGLVLGMAGLALPDARLARRPMAVAATLVLVVAVSAVGARAVSLGMAEGSNRHYADGSYTRAAQDGLQELTLTIEDGTFRIGDRWSGRLDERGLVVVLVDDPACPETRGTYRVFAADGEDIWWQQIVDVCADGERARDLETGIWRRRS